MKRLVKACVASALFLVPANTFAQEASAEKNVPSVACATKIKMIGVENGMGSMMAEMVAMKGAMRDPKMKAQMQKMHTQMSAMMANIETMNGGMMGHETASARKKKGATSSAEPPGAHQDHHPAQ